MVRKILIPDKQEVTFSIPESYVGKKIEVIIFALNEVDGRFSKPAMSDFWGTISDETANKLDEESRKSRDEWEDRLNKQ